jgi:hypothetical protein
MGLISMSERDLQRIEILSKVIAESAGCGMTGCSSVHEDVALHVGFELQAGRPKRCLLVHPILKDGQSVGSASHGCFAAASWGHFMPMISARGARA